MSNTKAFIDYAMQDNGTSAREVLYSEIHDRVMSHIEQKKMELAGGILNTEEKSCDYDDMKKKIAKKEEKVEKLKEELALMEVSKCDMESDEDDEDDYEDKKEKLKKTMKKLKKLKEELAMMESGDINENGEWEDEEDEDSDEFSEDE